MVEGEGSRFTTIQDQLKAQITTLYDVKKQRQHNTDFIKDLPDNMGLDRLAVGMSLILTASNG